MGQSNPCYFRTFDIKQRRSLQKINMMIMPNPRIKNEEQYEALRDRGYSKEKAARIANTSDAGEKGGKASPYEEWTKEQLYDQAQNVGIEGRSKMNKKELIQALRNN